MAYIAGRNACLEALKAGERVTRVLIEVGGAPPVALRPLLEVAAAARIPVERVPLRQLAAIHPRHQGVAVEVEEFRYASFDQVAKAIQADGGKSLVLALDQVQDPQNVGTLFRTALAV